VLHVPSADGVMSPGLGRRHAFWLAGAFVITMAVAYLGMLWNARQPPMGSRPGTIPMLVCPAVLSAVCRRVAGTPWRRTVLIVGSGVAAGCAVRVAVEVIRDPTSNNLWPIALFILEIMGLAASAVGVLLGSAARRVAGASRP